MVMIYADISRLPETNEMSINTFDLHNGTVKSSSLKKKTLKELASQLFNEVTKLKAQQVIIDKQGIGLGVYDEFIQIMKSNNMEYKQNGEVVFN